MTVAELIVALQKLPQDAIVVHSDAMESWEVCSVEVSGYSRSFETCKGDYVFDVEGTVSIS
jgi:hypothetical protein